MILTVTKEVLETLTTGNGGYTRNGLAVLGIKWPPEKGWKRKVLGRIVIVSALDLKREQEMVAWRKRRTGA